MRLRLQTTFPWFLHITTWEEMMEARLRKDCECLAHNGVIIQDAYIIKIFLLPNQKQIDTRFKLGFVGEIKECRTTCSLFAVNQTPPDTPAA